MMEIITAVTDPVTQFYDGVRAGADPRTKDWFLIWNSPVYVWACSVLYLLFVWIGPKVMRNYEPFQLRGFMIGYNTFLVGLSAYMVFEIWYSAYLSGYHPICQEMPKDLSIPSEQRLAEALWFYFVSKVIEFMDTILMVLRKKNDQITFLHVFHHVSMLNIWWHSLFLIPGGQSWFSTSLNSLVHVVMYLYYLLNAFPSLRPYLWWKRYITRFQLLQFFLILLHTSNTYISGCDFPMWSQFMLGGYMFIMLILFGNFYIQAYVKGQRRSPKHAYVNGNSNGYDVNHNNRKTE